MFKDKILIFWTFAFPIILGTLFSLAFSDIENNEKLSVIDIAVVNGEHEVFKSVFDSLSEGEDKIFDVKYVSEDEALKLLEEEEITGYVVLNIKPKVVVSTNGINETIFKYVVDEVIEYMDIADKLISIKMEDFSQSELDMNEFIANIRDEISLKMSEEVNVKDISSKNLSYTMIEFYTLIAMTALYGGIFAVVTINNSLANMSTKGARVAVSPTSKRTLIFSSLLSGYLVQLLGLFLLFIYTIFVLKVDYGSDLFLVILVALVGSFAGLSLGVFVASMFKTNENVKTGILIAVVMFGSFLSGMMGITMKYMIDSNVPILNKLNPAAMITDALYSLYYFEGRERFYFNIISLLLFSLILIGISLFSLRRQKYDSI